MPAGATNLTFKMSGGTGDADLYIKFGEKTTTSVSDCKPYKVGNVEDCTFATAKTGTYHVMLQGYEAFNGVSLITDYTPASSGGSSNIDKSDLSGALGSKAYFTINIPANAKKLTVKTTGGSGDVDLYLKHGSKPTENDNDCAPYQGGNEETCTQNNPTAGEWHIGLFGYESFSGVSLTATVE